MENYIYRILTFEDITQLHDLYKAAFQRKKIAGFFKWKYFNNPVEDAMVAGAFYNGKLVASCAMVPEKMKLFDKQVIVFKCTDLMTDPGHQRKGLSKKVNELLTNKLNDSGVPFLYTLCTAISTRSFLKNKWNFIKEVTNYFKPYALLRIQFLFKRKKFQDVFLFDLIDDQLNNYEFKSDTSKISVCKSVNFLKWRMSNPCFAYKIICHYNNNKQVNGYLIYSISTSKMLNIIDADTVDNDKKIIDTLLRYAEFIVVKEKYTGILLMTVENSSLHSNIKNKGYLKNPFNKGPLKTSLDFDAFKYDTAIPNFEEASTWDIYGLSYDDI